MNRAQRRSKGVTGGQKPRTANNGLGVLPAKYATASVAPAFDPALHYDAIKAARALIGGPSVGDCMPWAAAACAVLEPIYPNRFGLTFFNFVALDFDPDLPDGVVYYGGPMGASQSGKIGGHFALVDKVNGRILDCSPAGWAVAIADVGGTWKRATALPDRFLYMTPNEVAAHYGEGVRYHSPENFEAGKAIVDGYLPAFYGTLEKIIVLLRATKGFTTTDGVVFTR